MNPQAPTAEGYKSNYRLFHPQSTVWVINPLDHDVQFNVADENNRQYTYVLKSHETSELPGGAVATLGVKALVDEMIQNDKKDILRIWDLEVRKSYEDNVIVRFKEANNRVAEAVETGVIDLSVKGKTETEVPQTPAANVEEAFPGLNTEAERARVSDIAEASLGAEDVIVEDK